MPRAWADVVVPRRSLTDPAERRGIRVTLFRALSQLGHVERIDRFVADPPDGPYRDSGYDQLNRDEFAVVRVEGQVIPLVGSHSAPEKS